MSVNSANVFIGEEGISSDIGMVQEKVSRNLKGETYEKTIKF